MQLNPLVPYATQYQDSRGRLFSEKKSKYRTPFQRDRDRILHCQSFRRLKDKTQVFIDPQSAHTRTRLTHSLEVSQITRTIARFLGVNEDLAETIALAHDLGHPPFGHVGEDALQAFMEPYGGFDHNDQALRVVTKLEKRYPLWDGLNLTWESLEGLVKHNGPLKKADDSNDVLPPNIRNFNEKFDLELHSQSGIEGQIAAIADDIAYNHHDLEDGLNAGYFTIDHIAQDVPHVCTVVNDVRTDYTNLNDSVFQAEVIRRLMGKVVKDVLAETERRIHLYSPESAHHVRQLPDALVTFSPIMKQKDKELKSFLFKHMYRHPDILLEREKAAKQMTDLATYFMSKPEAMDGINLSKISDKAVLARTVLDYLACMTDKYVHHSIKEFSL